VADRSKGSVVVTVLMIPILSAILFVFFSVVLEVIEVVSNARVAAEGTATLVLGVASVLVAGMVLAAPRALLASGGRDGEDEPTA
jgi:hypothetical protein